MSLFNVPFTRMLASGLHVKHNHLFARGSCRWSRLGLAATARRPPTTRAAPLFEAFFAGPRAAVDVLVFFSRFNAACHLHSAHPSAQVPPLNAGLSSSQQSLPDESAPYRHARWNVQRFFTKQHRGQCASTPAELPRCRAACAELVSYTEPTSRRAATPAPSALTSAGGVNALCDNPRAEHPP